jgi:hypothetical protein
VKYACVTDYRALAFGIAAPASAQGISVTHAFFTNRCAGRIMANMHVSPFSRFPPFSRYVIEMKQEQPIFVDYHCKNQKSCYSHQMGRIADAEARDGAEKALGSRETQGFGLTCKPLKYRSFAILILLRFPLIRLRKIWILLRRILLLLRSALILLRQYFLFHVKRPPARRATPSGIRAPSRGSAPGRRASSRALSRTGRDAPWPRAPARCPCAPPCRSP